MKVDILRESGTVVHGDIEIFNLAFFSLFVHSLHKNKNIKTSVQGWEPLLRNKVRSSVLKGYDRLRKPDLPFD